MVIGILGVGHLGKILIEGLLAAGHQDLLLSSRGKTADLTKRCGLMQSADNADLVKASEVVILTVRTKDAVAAVAGLPWRAGQMIASACAWVQIADLTAVVPEGVSVHHIIPVTAAAQADSPTTLFPANNELERLLGAFGPVLPLGSGSEFETATVCATVYGWKQKLVQVTAEWSVAQGLPEASARQLAALTAVAAGRNIAGSTNPMDRLLTELATPWGITEKVLNLLEARGALTAWSRPAGL